MDYDLSLGNRDITESEAKKMASEGDLSGSGGLDFEEFATMMSKRMARTDPANAVTDAFQAFDLSRRGNCDVAELSEALKTFGNPLDPRELKDMLDVAKDGDTFIYPEFVAEMFGTKKL